MICWCIVFSRHSTRNCEGKSILDQYQWCNPTISVGTPLLLDPQLPQRHNSNRAFTKLCSHINQSADMASVLWINTNTVSVRSLHWGSPHQLLFMQSTFWKWKFLTVVDTFELIAIQRIHTHTQTHTHRHTHTHSHAHTHTDTHADAHTQTHTNTHIHPTMGGQLPLNNSITPPCPSHSPSPPLSSSSTSSSSSRSSSSSSSSCKLDNCDNHNCALTSDYRHLVNVVQVVQQIPE